jgi:DNA-binding CsgD family transcriptional regulator
MSELPENRRDGAASPGEGFDQADLVSMRVFTYLQAVAALRTSDLAAAVDFLGDASEVDGIEPFTTELLDRLLQLVPCEFATYQELDRATDTVFSYVACSAEGTTPDSDVPWVLSPGDLDSINRSVTLAERRRRGQFHGVMTWSDLVRRGRRLRYELNPDSQREWGIVDHACLSLNASDVRYVWLTFESTGRDFSERDRRVLELLEPHLAGRVRNARLRRQLAGLRASLEFVGDGRAIALIDPDGQIEFGSPAAERLLGAYFGEVNGRVPESIASWIRRRDGSRYTLARGPKRLVVQAVGDEGAYLLSEQPTVALTPRELDVMRCVAAGKSNPEIARTLWVAPGTVRKHLDNVYEKLGVRSRTAALAALGMTAQLG